MTNKPGSGKDVAKFWQKSKNLDSPVEDVKPTEEQKERMKSLMSQLVVKHNELEFERLTKEELIDIVHRAKCGKLKSLDTSDLTKDEIIGHLVYSKCPEILSILEELKHLHYGLERFVDKYLKDGRKITVDNIYYCGLQKAIVELFFYQAYKEKRYDCIVRHNMSGTFSQFSFDFTVSDIVSSVVMENLRTIARRIQECVAKGVKIVAIPIQYNFTATEGHENAVIYRVDSKTFERFEPHGSETGGDFISQKHKTYLGTLSSLMYLIKYDLFHQTFEVKKEKKSFGREISKIDKWLERDYNAWINAYDRKTTPTDVQLLESARLQEIYFKRMEDYFDTYYLYFVNKFKKLINQLGDVNTTNTIEKYLNILNNKEYKLKYEFANPAINKYLNGLFTDTLPKIDKFFEGSKYIAPDIVNFAKEGLQAVEPAQIMKKYGIDADKYNERVGGFCVMWSVMYFDLVFQFPDATPAILNQKLLQLLEKKGEYAFGELALGYLQGFKDFIDKHLGKTDYTKFTRTDVVNASELGDKLKKFVVL